ncbi:MAG: hypothetical protein ABIP50_00120 [Candidatus Saccharimonadales bacterium]
MSLNLEAPKMKLGSDVDDVLLDTAPLTIQMHNEQYGTRLTLEEWYNAEHTLDLWKTDTLQQAFDQVNVILGSDEFIERVEPVKGVMGVIEEAGDIDGVTGRPHWLKDATFRSLARHIPGQFGRGNIDFTDFGGSRHVSKVVIAQREGFTNFVEDLPKHANELAVAGFRTVLFGKNPWTRPGVYHGISREIHPDLITAGDHDALREFLVDEKARLASLAPGEKIPMNAGKRHY